ncbi:hypothetical protein PSSHI_27710 [Photobacterium sp. R1]
MNLIFERQYMLPAWIFIWIIALIVFADLFFLRAPPSTVMVYSAILKDSGKGIPAS